MAAIIISAISVIVTLALAAWGFRRTSKLDRLRGYFEIHKLYLEPQVRAGRSEIHREIAGMTAEQLRDRRSDDFADANHALAIMNAVAIAYYHNFVDRALIASTIANSYTRAVDSARAYIDELERERGVRPYPYAERLARELSRAEGPV